MKVIMSQDFDSNSKHKILILLVTFDHLLDIVSYYSLENPSDLTHSLTLWQPDLSLPRLQKCLNW